MPLIMKIIEWDDRGLGSLEPIRHSLAWRKAFLSVTATGNGGLYVVVAALMCLLDQERALPYMTCVLTAFGLGLPAHVLLKKGIKRRRPCEGNPRVSQGFKPVDRFSFPSGHTTHAFLMATVLAFFFPMLTVPLYLWATSVGISRVYLGVHYPSDVLAGVLLGLLCAWIGLYAAGY